jgi:hypothetical protein
VALTEPQAGSSLSDLVTSAAPNADGTYSIRGKKIFISGGNHELAKRTRTSIAASCMRQAACVPVVLPLGTAARRADACHVAHAGRHDAQHERRNDSRHAGINRLATRYVKRLRHLGATEVFAKIAGMAANAAFRPVFPA